MRSIINLIESIQKINEGAADILRQEPSETSRYDLAEKEDETLDLMVGEFRSGKYPGGAPWTVVPAARLTRIWQQAAKTGFVRDERGLDEIANRFITNIIRVWVNTVIAGHSERQPEDVLADYDMDEEEMERFISWAVDCESGWRISDYGFPRLHTLAALLMDCEDTEQKLVVIDAILNVTHQRSDLASWFVEGGTRTLNQLAND